MDGFSPEPDGLGDFLFGERNVFLWEGALLENIYRLR